MMNVRKILTASIFLISFFCLNLHSNSLQHNELNGNQLCNEVYSYLERNNYNPHSQELIMSGENEFPYNIIIENNNTTYTKKNIIFTFFQEDVLTNKDLISQFINYVDSENYDFNIIFLFSYGERQKIKKQGMIYGIDSFLETINTNDDYTNIIIDLASKSNSIETSSNGIVAPSWLIQNEYNAYIKYGFDEEIPFFYLSQMYTYSFIYNRMLSSFFEYNVPTVKLNFKDSLSTKNGILNILTETIESYSTEQNRSWDRHFFMVKIFDNFKKLTEERTVQIIIIIIFAWLLFLFLFFFINARLKKQAWGSVKHIWYSVPITFLLVVAGFIIGKSTFLTFFTTDSSIRNAFTMGTIQIIISLILVSLYYALTLLYNYSFYEKSIDYLIVISCFINQSFFILIDISLFPMFMAICMLSLIAISVKRNFIHIIIFFLMIIPYMPYILQIINYANFDALYPYLISNNIICILIPLIIYPLCLIYFRVLTSIRRKSKINIPILIGIVVLVLSIAVAILSNLKIKKLENKSSSTDEQYILATTEDLIDFTYKDNKVFDDIIRTLNISFAEQPEQCSVTVTSISTTPILYTENAFEYLTSSSSMFKIPSNPPKTLTFKYGSTKEPTIITISAIFKTEDSNDYKSTKKVVTIGHK